MLRIGGPPESMPPEEAADAIEQMPEATDVMPMEEPNDPMVLLQHALILIQAAMETLSGGVEEGPDEEVVMNDSPEEPME